MRKVLRRRVRRRGESINVVADVQAVVAATNRHRDRSGASSRQRLRIVQRDGRTEVSEDPGPDETLR